MDIFKKILQLLNIQPSSTDVIEAKSNGVQQVGWNDSPEGRGYVPVYNTDNTTPKYKTLPSENTPLNSQPASNGSGFNISIPDENGKTFNIPKDIAQQLGNVFDKEGIATQAAQVLRHPMEQTRTPEELARGLTQNFNRGENPDMIKSNIDIPNPNNSIDRGLFRINSDTFSGMMKDPTWRQYMANKGITDWKDMEDYNKNTEMARLILARGNYDKGTGSIQKDPSWKAWYASPLKLRQ